LAGFEVSPEGTGQPLHLCGRIRGSLLHDAYLAGCGNGIENGSKSNQYTSENYSLVSYRRLPPALTNRHWWLLWVFTGICSAFMFTVCVIFLEDTSGVVYILRAGFWLTALTVSAILFLASFSAPVLPDLRRVEMSLPLIHVSLFFHQFLGKGCGESLPSGITARASFVL
jgi:hypothetical protein